MNLTPEEVFANRNKWIGKTCISNYARPDQDYGKVKLMDITYEKEFLTFVFDDGDGFGGAKEFINIKQLKNGSLSVSVTYCGSMTIGVPDA